MNTEDANGRNGRRVALRDALSIFEDLDRYRNLRRGVAIVVFLVSAGCGVRAFFLLNESVLWAGIHEQLAYLLVCLAWVLLFPIMALVFLLIMSVLDAMGIKDLRAAVRYRLSNLSLSQDQLLELRDVLASRPWRHGRMFRKIISDLMIERQSAL
jgi:hypothetical protein